MTIIREPTIWARSYKEKMQYKFMSCLFELIRLATQNFSTNQNALNQ